jgi:hypothetical protein
MLHASASMTDRHEITICYDDISFQQLPQLDSEGKARKEGVASRKHRRCMFVPTCIQILFFRSRWVARWVFDKKARA